jgi:hypothetical protein
MSSSGVMRISVPGGTRSCFFGRFCPSSRRYHDHSVGRRSPSRSLAMTSGRAFRSSVSFPWSWILWFTKVLIDGGSGLNLIFISTLKKMGLDFKDMLVPSMSPFYGIVPGLRHTRLVWWSFQSPSAHGRTIILSSSNSKWLTSNLLTMQ